MALSLRLSLRQTSLVTATLISLALGSSAFAYKDGTYTCKHGSDAKLPANVYKISTVDVAGAGANVPFVDLVSYFREDPSNLNSVVHESHLKGFATAWSDTGDNETLLLGYVRLDFNKGTLANCTQ